VSVCGEVAADPVGTVALAALGVSSLSVPVNRFAATREALFPVAPRTLPALRTELLEQRTTAAIRDLLAQQQRLR
jgi:phosphoenolpyruvate-protein kinase (PTS system EI component)